MKELQHVIKNEMRNVTYIKFIQNSDKYELNFENLQLDYFQCSDIFNQLRIVYLDILKILFISKQNIYSENSF